MVKEDRRSKQQPASIGTFPAIYTTGSAYRPLRFGEDPKYTAPNTRPLSPTNGTEWARNLTHLVAEVVSGRRDISSLRRWLRPSAFNKAKKCVENQENPHPQVLRTKISMINVKAAEISLILDDGQRVTALALRAQATRNKWMITEFIEVK